MRIKLFCASTPIFWVASAQEASSRKTMDAIPSFLPPTLSLPTAPALPPRMTLRVPSAEVPSYRPLVMPSAAQMRQMAAEAQAAQEQKEESKEEKPAPRQAPVETKSDFAPTNEITTFTLPGTSIDVPVPRAEIVSTAVITAGASSVAAVAGTLAAGQIFRYLQKILKPLMKTALKRLAIARGKTPAESDARQKWRRYGRTTHTGRNQV